MRIRQIKPEFFGDADMACIPFRARLTYIGLWCIADDSGWLPVDAVQIAHDLYGFDARKAREAWVIADLVTLQEYGRLTVFDCGHGYIPTLERHQRMTSGTRRVEMHQKAHASRCYPPTVGGGPRGSGDLRGLPPSSGAERNGMEQERNVERNVNGTVARAGATSEAPSGGLRETLAARGLEVPR